MNHTADSISVRGGVDSMLKLKNWESFEKKDYILGHRDTITEQSANMWEEFPKGCSFSDRIADQLELPVFRCCVQARTNRSM